MNQQERDKLMRRWKRLAIRVHAHFALNRVERHTALEDARANPYRALNAYRAIANSLSRG